MFFVHPSSLLARYSTFVSFSPLPGSNERLLLDSAAKRSLGIGRKSRCSLQTGRNVRGANNDVTTVDVATVPGDCRLDQRVVVGLATKPADGLQHPSPGGKPRANNGPPE